MQSILIRSAVLAAACLCGIATPHAQQPALQQPPPSSSANAPATGLLAGQVIDAATKKPVAGAMVGLAGSGLGPAGRGGPPLEMVADSQGRFAFAALLPGRYTVISQHPGYASVFGAPSRAVDLTNGGRVTDVVVRLQPFTSIAGTVTDENGDPVTAAGVSAFRQTVVNGRLVTTATNEARTDDRGEYRLNNLPAADYVVCACRQDQIPLDGVLLSTLAAEPAQLLGLAARAIKVGADVASIDGMRTMGPAFYPSSPTMTHATHVVLAEGESRTNIDIQVPIVRPARISGTIVGAPGGINANAVRLRPAGEVPSVAATIEPMVVQPDGRFDFAGVPPGTYVLSAWLSGVPAPMGGPSGVVLQLTGGRGGQQMQQVAMDSIVWGQTAVVVGDSDLTGITVNLRRAPTVKVKVELPADVTPSPTQLQRPTPQIQFLRLAPMSLDIRGGGQPARPDPSLVFTLSSAGPGKYFMDVGSSLQVAKVTIAGEDVTDMPIDIGDADITDAVVTLVRPARTVISGTVSGAGADTTVVIFPADPRLWIEPAASRRLFTTAVVDRAGRFSTSPNLVAGSYLAAAVPDEQAVNWIVQARLQALATRAQKVTVAAGETKTIEVKR